MNRHHIIAFMVVTLPVLFFFGCVSVNSFLPIDFCVKPVDPNMARIEFTRIWQVGSGGRPMRVYDNDQPIGDLGPGTKICWDRYPGNSLIIGRDAYLLSTSLENCRVEFNAKANTVYYVKGGFYGKWTVSLTPD